MKFLVVLLALASVAYSEVVPDNNTAFGYLKNSIKDAERIQKREEAQSRIIGGVPAALGQHPHQAGLIIDIVGVTQGRGVCGASLVSTSRLISAAHCWFDGQNQGWRVEVVLGSVTLFTGGQRQHTSVFINHPNWFPSLVRNDVGVIYLPTPVTVSNNIAPVALPTGSLLTENFDGQTVVASGFGLTSDDGSIAANQFLSHVSLRVVANSVCRFAFPLILQDSNICTSGIGSVGACRGDSGGPLVITRDNRQVLVGVVSFGNGLSGCEGGLPSVYARVTSFISFFQQHL